MQKEVESLTIKPSDIDLSVGLEGTFGSSDYDEVAEELVELAQLQGSWNDFSGAKIPEFSLTSFYLDNALGEKFVIDNQDGTYSFTCDFIRDCYNKVMENKFDRLQKEFLDELSKTTRLITTSKQPFVLALIGIPGSGRTTDGRYLAPRLHAKLIQANSARKILKDANLPRGDNVREILRRVGKVVLSEGYNLILDGNALEEKDRKNIAEMAGLKSGVKVFYIRVRIGLENACQREKEKYNNPKWISSFDDFRVSDDTEKMVQNVRDRFPVEQALKSGDIPGLIGEIDNDDSLDRTYRQLDVIICKMRNLR
jgi:predicted kinase